MIVFMDIYVKFGMRIEYKHTYMREIPFFCVQKCQCDDNRKFVTYVCAFSEL